MHKKIRLLMCIIVWIIGSMWYLKIPGFTPIHILILTTTFIFAFIVLLIPIRGNNAFRSQDAKEVQDDE